MILQTHLQFPKTAFKLSEHSIQVSNLQQWFPMKKTVMDSQGKHWHSKGTAAAQACGSFLLVPSMNVSFSFLVCYWFDVFLFFVCYWFDGFSLTQRYVVSIILPAIVLLLTGPRTTTYIWLQLEK
ncbi:hypothetical protein RHGRI_003958 [Rhododendron griersonianum]|uniref:Uncharacterized protein n=1 Tax=Rhododendron griersonianum TaxID=479676 RepID=A0AAV6L751_9ERIC|nr:hypothetical protein RHGRI_003958 [Rhododendron griersonianum]